MEPVLFNRQAALRQKDDWVWTIDQLKVRIWKDATRWFWSIKYADLGGFTSKDPYSELHLAVHAAEDMLTILKLDLQALTRYPGQAPGDTR